MLKAYYSFLLKEAGCDEAGCGAVAGPVVAGVVILPKTCNIPLLNDSKQLTKNQRQALVPMIKNQAVAWAIGEASAQEVDVFNILNARFLAMHRAIQQLSVVPELLLIDGNRFKPYANIPYTCIIKGDAQFNAIAAASILAKTYRDQQMALLALEYPGYGWEQNVGYPTLRHRQAIANLGPSIYHRKTFHVGLNQHKSSSLP